MIFVNTDYFLAFLLEQEDTQEQQKAKELFDQGALGEVDLFTSAIVFFELYWVLNLVYEQNKQEIIKILQNVLKMSFIKLRERNLLVEAVKLYQEKKELDLETAYNIVYAEQNEATAFKTKKQQVKKIVNLK
jgi:predicted nucleic-acid-binding protein